MTYPQWRERLAHPGPCSNTGVLCRPGELRWEERPGGPIHVRQTWAGPHAFLGKLNGYSMKTVILTLAEYAAFDQAGKLIVAGTCDGVSLQRRDGIPPDGVGVVPIPPLYLVAVFQGGIGDGLAHRLDINLLSEDKKEVAKILQGGEFRFQVNKFGRPMRAQVLLKLPTLPVPQPGDYEFVILVDGKELAVTPLYVTDETPSLGA
jgi:hypothetical protein